MLLRLLIFYADNADLVAEQEFGDEVCWPFNEETIDVTFNLLDTITANSHICWAIGLTKKS
jgi:hypothetical protein